MKILVLSTWFPYPVNQGSKIRAYHLIRGLAKHHQIALLSFEDAPVQAGWRDHMLKFCERVEVVPRQPFHYDRWKTILGFFSAKPSAVFAGYSPEMETAAVRTAAEWQPDLVFALTFVTAPYALKIQGIPRVVDMDNLLAIMLHEQYQRETQVLLRARRYLAYWKLRRYESQIYRQFDLALVCSQRDAGLARDYIPLRPEQIGVVPNGVDLDYYNPNIASTEIGALVYNGAITYEPNLDAMQYFLTEVYPRVLARQPGTSLKITGRTQGAAIDRLPTANGRVIFTGYLDDVRPVVAGSHVCIVPLRLGAGTRLKILEAMALGTPVVSTSKGAEGLDVEPGRHLLIADTPEDFAAATLQLLEDGSLRRTMSQQAYDMVKTKYNWDQIGQDFCALVEKIQRQGTMKV